MIVAFDTQRPWQDNANAGQNACRQEFVKARVRLSVIGRERSMKRLSTVLMVMACGAGAVWAGTDPIAQRRALMKNDGIAAKALFDMAKGTVPFNLAVAQSSLSTLATGAEKSPALFPDNSKTGGGTAALPAI